MIEIKFRAWDKKNKKWIYFDKRDDKDYYLEWSKYGLRLIYYTREMDVKYIYDFDIVQYTGLKDKNGKEIYEGDILSDDTPNGKQIIGVKWDMWRLLDDLQNGINTYEIIGNIYENPELIE